MINQSSTMALFRTFEGIYQFLVAFRLGLDLFGFSMDMVLYHTRIVVTMAWCFLVLFLLRVIGEFRNSLLLDLLHPSEYLCIDGSIIDRLCGLVF